MTSTKTEKAKEAQASLIKSRGATVHFTTDFVDELLAKVDITEVMRSHGVRVKQGSLKNDFYIADFCCGKSDYDNGRIKKKTQTYKCEACGDHGNAIHYLTRYAGKTFQEAVTELANMVGMDLPVKVDGERKYLALKLAADFYHQQNNYEYFLSRGISLEVLKKYKAGYAPGGRSLRNYLEQQGFTKEEMTEYKLLNKKGLDKFFYRAVIPIFMNGKVIDLYGRATDDTAASVKHLYLYGDISFLGGYDFLGPGLVTIFESFIDQLVAESHGNKNGTNAGGSNKFNGDHARLLKKRKTEKVLVIYDPDTAGREGALSAGERLEASGIECWIGNLPEGKDPAEIITQDGMDVFKGEIDTIPFRQAQMYKMLSQYSISEIEQYLIDKKRLLSVSDGQRS